LLFCKNSKRKIILKKFKDFINRIIKFNKEFLYKETSDIDLITIKYNVVFLITTFFYTLFWFILDIKILGYVTFSYLIISVLIYFFHFYGRSLKTSKYILFISGSLCLYSIIVMVLHVYPLIIFWAVILIILPITFFKRKTPTIILFFNLIFISLAIPINKHLVEHNYFDIKQIQYSNIVNIISFLVPLIFVHFAIKIIIKILFKEKKRLLKTQIYREKFYAHISHEIRTPMNAIIGITNILKKSSLNQYQTEYINTIDKASNNLLILLNDMLDLSKIEAGKSIIENKPFYLDQAIKFVYEINKNYAQSKNLRFNYSIADNVDLKCIGDENRLDQILINIIHNAIKFTQEGHVELIVSQIENNPSDQKICFEINDTGVGINDDFLPYIFDDFTQENRVKVDTGTGLGLSLTKKFINHMNGTIRIESKINIGTSFIFEIIFDKHDIEFIEEEDNKEKKNKLENITVLVVEDNLTNQLVAKKLLTFNKAKVILAENGKIAIDVLNSQKKIDVILMDLSMPVLDGIEATKKIRNNLKLDIPIIALTANAIPEIKKTCFEIGMNDFIIKPFKEIEMVNKILLTLKK